MTDLTSLGYPKGYHIGLSAILWWISIAFIAILGIKLILNAGKSDLINVKDMLRAKGIAYFFSVIYFSLIQVGVLFPNYFIYLTISGVLLGSIGFLLYYYNWEKYLTSIKRIPTFSSGATIVVSIIELILLILFSGLFTSLWGLLVLIYLILIGIAEILYIYLIYTFSKNVRGVSNKVSWIWMGGMILFMITFFLEHPPGISIFPNYIVYYLPPILLPISLGMAYYGINTLFVNISSYYAQTQKCAVHRGVIGKGSTVHYCPSCGITYCDKCFNQVILHEGCWNCRKGADPEIEKEWKIEQAKELKKADKLKPKNPKR
jgi:hypothetical protein